MFEVPQRQQLASEDSVPERAYWGTEYACRAQKGFLGYATHFRGIRCKKQASTVRMRYSVPETPSYGTEPCVGNSLL